MQLDKNGLASKRELAEQVTESYALILDLLDTIAILLIHSARLRQQNEALQARDALALKWTH